MAKKLTTQEIENIIIAYNKIGSYAGAARETSFSASTVKKYVLQSGAVAVPARENLPPIDTSTIDTEIKPISEIQLPKTQSDWANWCNLTEKEETEILSWSKGLVV